MKIRNYFVSNSSSSSFIVGIGVIKDKEKFNEWRERFKEYNYEITSYTPEELELEIDREYSSLHKINGKYYLDAPYNDGYHDVELSEKDCKDKDVVIVRIGNNEGDGDFWVQTGKTYYDGYLDYHIDISNFPNKQEELFSSFNRESAGISHSDITFGAGRNG